MTRNDSTTQHGTAARIAFVAIGAVAYLGFHAVFLSMISFLNGGPLPWSSYQAPARPLGIALAINAGFIFLFGVQHAVMARNTFKARWTRIVPAPIERSLFVVATVLCLGATLAFWQPMGGGLFSIETPAVRIALYGVQAMGWLVLVWSTFLIDHFELFGLRQVYYAMRRRELPVQRFRTPALYRYSRHPMMVGMVIGLWATPDMTWDRLAFALGFSFYILVGVRLEERELVQNLGDDYRRYQNEVARFLPLPGMRTRMASAAVTGALFVALAASFLAPRIGLAQTLSTDLAPDISIQHAGGVVHDHEMALDVSGGGGQVASVGGLPIDAGIDGYHLTENGDELFSLGTPTTLPGGLTPQPGDVVRWDGTQYSLEFDASNAGLSPAVDTDAVSMVGSLLLLSFDTAVVLSGLHVDDEDVVSFDGLDFALYLDGEASGVPAGLDLDGLHAFGANQLGLSFDGSGVISTLSFDDEDVLRVDRTTSQWSMEHDGSSVSEAWRSADVGAVAFVPEPSVAMGLTAGALGLAGAQRRRRCLTLAG